MQPLLEFSAEHIPADDHADTPIVLLATAGLRLLPENHAESLLGAAREVLAETGFRSSPEWTGMLSGQDEGLYSWLAASYGSGMLHKRLEDSGMDADSSPGVAGWETTGDADSSSAAGAPVGLVELGGASAQVGHLLALCAWPRMPTAPFKAQLSIQCHASYG